jgi:enoyl-CoA hydratase/carnithine racemase
MPQGTVSVECNGGPARITLNRPEVLNAMNLAWVQALEAAVNTVAAEPDVRVVLVRGAGLDLDMLGRDGIPPGFYEGQERAFCGLEAIDKITIAVLHGYCLGGGLQLAIACDIRICSTECGLGQPAVLEGLFPGMAPFRLPRLIGLGPARRLILSGEVLGLDEALRLGMIDHLVPAARFETGVAEVLERHLRAPRSAAMASKRLLRRAFEAPLAAVCQESQVLLAECLASPDVQAAGTAWRQRRAERRGEQTQWS